MQTSHQPHSIIGKREMEIAICLAICSLISLRIGLWVRSVFGCILYVFYSNSEFISCFVDKLHSNVWLDFINFFFFIIDTIVK